MMVAGVYGHSAGNERRLDSSDHRMRWGVCEEWNWHTRLSVLKIRALLPGGSAEGRSSSAKRSGDFVGSTSETGFQLTPVAWGQASFLPRLIGRWQASDSGT